MSDTDDTPAQLDPAQRDGVTVLPDGTHAFETDRGAYLAFTTGADRPRPAWIENATSEDHARSVYLDATVDADSTPDEIDLDWLEGTAGTQLSTGDHLWVSQATDTAIYLTDDDVSFTEIFGMLDPEDQPPEPHAEGDA